MALLTPDRLQQVLAGYNLEEENARCSDISKVKNYDQKAQTR